MRSIASIIIRKALALLTALALLCGPALGQELTSDTFSVGMISVKTMYLNPLWALERDFQSLHSLIYESLIRLDDKYEPEPYIASRWEMSENGKSWTFFLRDDVYFSDGTRLTAYDVAATVTDAAETATEAVEQAAETATEAAGQAAESVQETAEQETPAGSN